MQASMTTTVLRRRRPTNYTHYGHERAKRHEVGGFNLTFVRIHDDRSVIMKTHVAFLLFPRQYVIIDPIVDPMSNHIMPACYTNLLLIAVVR